MKRLKKLPIGIERFEEIRTEGFYYVDKTNMIRDLLYSWGKVNLFTRPRRFGKSLNMSMLKSFFEIGCDKSLFDGLNISEEKELCQQYMGKFPVISISLKAVSGENYQSARAMLCSVIGEEALHHRYLLESDIFSESEKELYRKLIAVDKSFKESFQMSDDTLTNGILRLSQMLQRYYDRQVIILIDEYDVPLEKAYHAGYYNSMIEIVRKMLLQALKTNDSLYFAVMTGCLRISKESIFTGLNNPKVLSITDVRFQEYFGFTDQEVKQMLSYYQLEECYDTIKEWYDGYRFGNIDVYCPWDVLSYCDALCADPEAFPENYWSNTSSNDIVRRFINKAERQTQDEIERLIAGEAVIKEVKKELTYNELEASIDNLWSVLFTTGYLTQRGKAEGRRLRLMIPNKEIREIFVSQIKEWFDSKVSKDRDKLDAFLNALAQGDADAVETGFNAYLAQTISIRDTSVPLAKKENFYHGILLGMLSYMGNWSVYSNMESGDGYSDILMKNYSTGTGIIIEVKYAENNALEEGCSVALQQIEDMKYADGLVADGMQKLIKYGIACFKKHCKVVIGE